MLSAGGVAYIEREALPFGAEALTSPVALLNALQGAEIRIGGSHPVTGKLRRVVPETARAQRPECGAAQSSEPDDGDRPARRRA
jgi:hypothetical protein